MFEKFFAKKPAHEQTDITRRFNLIGRVGQGSMSKVWKAVDLQSGRTVALKVLDKEKTQKLEERFKGLKKPTEADVAMSLSHPNIVKTWEFGWTTEDEMFLVMEFVEGVGLALLVDLQNDEMKRYRLRYMIQIGEAIQHFHQQNWIHRDICPRNVMIGDDKSARLIDFGLAVPNTPEFRRPGNRTGTASYMAPELIKRQPTDQRIDIFSYAVTCFEMYSKRFPWDAALTIDAVLQHINKPPLEITTIVPGIDSQIAAAIMKGLKANPDERWQKIGEMVAEIREAEMRLVKLAREAAAAKAKAAGSASPATATPAPTQTTATQAATAADRSQQAGKSEAAGKPAVQGDAAKQAGKKPARNKKRSGDDDIDLTALFAE
ncbi:MAG TPA: serine/threonine protein kinase [Planctomycetaceae bacterium]|nr:serine/threonine protein kinase [Planctomycetaceae bacterium]